jgi:hypothetical protein
MPKIVRFSYINPVLSALTCTYIDPKHYYCIPDEGIHEDIPFSLVLRPPRGLDNFFANETLTEPHAVMNYPQTRSMSRVPFWACLSREEMGIQVRYLAGYSTGKAPPDLASACLELAAWNMSRYRGRRIGMTGNVRGSGKDGEHLEASMPENVRQLLEPYKRRVI